jgi:hypothetical protein
MWISRWWLQVFVVVVGFDPQLGVEREVQPFGLNQYSYRHGTGFWWVLAANGWEAGQTNEKRSYIAINMEGRYVPLTVRPLLSLTTVGRPSTLDTYVHKYRATVL